LRPIAAGADKLRIAVLGAGSIGCFVGGCWQFAGLDVRFVGRPGFARDISKHGLTLSDYSGWQAGIAPGDVDYTCEADALADADIIALCVKSGATAAAARQIAEHACNGALVISLQNGVSNVDVLERELGDGFTVVRGMVSYNVAYLGEGRFHKGVAGEIWAEDRPMVRELAEKTAGSPASLRLSGDMLGVAWGKLLINLNNAVNALSGLTLIEQLGQRDYRRVVAASMTEGLALLHRAGIRPAKTGPVSPQLLPKVIAAPDWLFNKLFLKLQKIDARARSSMADDLAAGRRTEVDYLNGELVRLAGELGMDAPINRKVVELIRKAEGGAPPLPPTALRREVLGR
jgi:2-dehydropantoate 2-reductase